MAKSEITGKLVTRTLEEIRERRNRGLSKTDWDRINAMTDEEIERNALEDNRRHGIDDDWYKGAERVNGIDEVLAYMNRTDDSSGSSDSDSKK